MGSLVVWLGFCLVVALVGVVRPTVPIAVALLLLGLVPASASATFTGVEYTLSTGLPSLHPGTWVVVVSFCVLLVLRPMSLLEALVRTSPLSWVLWLLGLGIALSTTLISHGSQGLSQAAETLIGPALLAALVIRLLSLDPGYRRSLLLSLQLYGLLVAALAVAEGLLRSDLVWGGVYSSESWHQSYGLSGFRATVFGGHPLNTALLLLAVLPLMRMRVAERFRPGMLGVVVVLAGVAATGSRSALLIGVGYVVLVSLRSVRTAVPAVAGVATLLLIVELSPFGQLWLERLTTDTNSSYVRFGALPELVNNLGDFVLSGRGVGFSGEVSRDLLGQAVSFENGFLMMALDIGILATAILTAAMITLALRNGFRSWSPATTGFVLALAMCCAYSSFGTKSTAAYLVWLLAALAPAVLAARQSPVVPVEVGAGL